MSLPFPLICVDPPFICEIRVQKDFDLETHSGGQARNDQ
jgi:hypothetical protein